MPIENLEVIDVISIDLYGNVVLTISDDLKWDDSSKHLSLLQDKVNSYLNSITNGFLYANYPNAKGRNIVINIAAKYEPDINAKMFLNKLEEILSSSGYGFNFSLLKKT